ncbi:MAG: efflux RND transporter permease subunit [Flavobacteriales bacterium]|nr:efflux RND transporter permease subunit [Flavobacteriales bacterium]MDG2086049.1 efflux RND transporter permease subunit [Flavobacteriales bacterium]
MKKLIAYFIKYPIYSNAIIIITAIAGILSLSLMPKSFFPELSPNKIYVNVSYPGASPEEIEEGITTRIEESLNGIEGIENITSTSSENISNVTVEIYEGFNIDEILQNVKNSVDAIYSFPQGAEKPNIQKQNSRGMGGMGNIVGFYCLTGPNDLWQLKDKADKIEQDLLNDDEISQIQVIGYAPIIISVEIDESALIRHNINFDLVSTAIKLSNIDISGGSIKTAKDEIIIRSNNRNTSTYGVENIVVFSNRNGDIVRLKDLAKVSLVFSDIAVKSYVNGDRAINFIIKKTPDEDIKKIANVLGEYIEIFNSENPDFEIVTLFQFADMLDERIKTLSDNLLLGLFLVSIVLGLFLSFRLSLWVAFGIPFSFIGMISIGLIYGMTINMISLFGMILVVGILVDDGIVIAENIYSHFERGKTPMQAALDGTMEVITPVFTSVLTTVFVFSTLLFVGGQMEMMQEMAFSVIAALLFSLIEAFLILPSHLASKEVLQKDKNTKYSKFKQQVEKKVMQLRDWYTNINMNFVENYRKHVWTPVLMMVIVIILLATGIIRWTFFPSVPFNEVKIEFSYKPGEREFRTENFLWYLDTIISNYNQELIEEYNDTIFTDVSLTVGFTENLGISGSHVGGIRVAVKENELISTIEISNELKRRIHPDSIAVMEKISVGGVQQFGKAVSISLQSEDDKELKDAVNWLKNGISSINMVKEVIDNGGIGNREIHIDLKEKAYALGLNEATVMKQIRQGFFGEEAQRLILGRDEIKIWLRYPENDRNSIEDLNKVKIKTLNGAMYPLEEIANYEFKRGRVKINHINGTKEIRVDATLFNAEFSGDVNEQIERDYLSVLANNYPNVQYKIMGQAEKAADSGKRLGIAFLISIILITITISLNFKSFYQARLILMVVPLGIFSAILGHGIIGKPFSIMSVWGVVALIGILVNDAIVMLDKYNRNLKQGMTMKEAVINAGKNRFRPIILTTITTFVGLAPLILEKSFQAQFLVPMAISVAFGVLFSTIILLLYFPSLILYFNDLRRARWWLWIGGKVPPTRMQVEPYTKLNKREIEIEN